MEAEKYLLLGKLFERILGGDSEHIEMYVHLRGNDLCLDGHCWLDDPEERAAICEIVGEIE